MTGFERVVADLGAIFGDPRAWWTVVVGLAFGALCTTLGVLIARRTAFLREDARTISELAIGLAVGLIAATVTYATVRSGGMSAYVPCLAFLVVAVAVGDGPLRVGIPGRRWLAPSSMAGLATIVIGVVYGVTISPSPRDGVQPIEFMDEAFYGVLGSTLRSTGIENVYLPAGFGSIEGLPAQSFYHWGELWLGALLQEVPGVTPMLGRHLAVLPLIIVSTCLVTAAVAGHQVTGRRRREVLGLAAFGMLAIAPIPLILQWHFDWWARAMLFSITSYGLAYVIVVVGFHAILVGTTRPTRGATILFGSLVAALVASHLLVAAISAVAIATAVLWAIARRRSARWAWALRGVGLACVAGGLSTVAWGFLTSHGLGDGGTVVGVAPFGPAWIRAMLFTIAGAGILLVGPVLAMRDPPAKDRLPPLAVGVCAATVAGAVLWGLLLADFNAFHLYFGAVAVLLTPLAVIAVSRAISSRRLGAPRAALLLLVVLLAQATFGVGAAVQRLYEFGPGHYDPAPLSMLDAIRELPADAKLAYSCTGYEEFAFWDGRLISLTAHTGRPVVPMCFQSDGVRIQLGVIADPWIANPFFEHAPQRAIYPTYEDRPTPDQIAAFMRTHGIEFVWVDDLHPNDLVPGAVEIAREGQFSLLRVP